MIPSLSQETITEYASEAQTIQEPTGTDYSQGVRVGKTIPAKWWNWLFRGTTRRLSQAKTDAQNMLTELQNVVTDAGITLSAGDSGQLSKAVVKDASTQINAYVAQKQGFMAFWGSRSMPVPLADYNNVVLMTQCNGLFIIMAKDSGHKVCVAVSTDMKSWRIVVETTYTGTLYGGVCDCRYYNNAFYLVCAIGADVSSPNENISVYKSTDSLSWTKIYGDTNYRRLEGVFLGVMNNHLYFYYNTQKELCKYSWVPKNSITRCIFLFKVFLLQEKI